MVASIPKYTGKWTNFNPSDPGITIIELLSWIAETTLYRINRIPDKSYVNFLRLIAGASGVVEVERMLTDPHLDKYHRNILELLKEIEEGHEKNIADLKNEVMLFLTSRYRAVTEADFRQLAFEAADQLNEDVGRGIIEKVPAENLIRIILVPDRWKQYEALTDVEKQGVYQELVVSVNDYLRSRTLIGTKIEVRKPVFSDLSIELKVLCHQYVVVEKITINIKQKILQHLDPFVGGDERTGWPYRRALSIYEVAQIVEETDGVRQVESIVFNRNKELKVKHIDGLIKIISLNVEVKKEEK